MKIKCENGCRSHFDLELDVTVRSDGSIYEVHLADLKMEKTHLEKWLACSECGGKVVIEDYN